ncbi:MAG: hypothetical protein KC777_21830 [Cyanobacteria bacterium HKST-UBA02]|nr:hypothetical protein [Cyanobacteria bacterium HKST-UBA02]
MSCRQNYECDPVKQEARSLSHMLDSGRHTGEVADALRADSYNMSSRDFNRLVTEISHHDRRDRGDNLVTDRQGNLVIDTGHQGFVVATRDFDMRQAQYRQQHGHHHGQQAWGRQGPGQFGQPGQYEQGNYYDQRDPVLNGVVHVGIGAVVGAAVDGKKGAIAGGAGGLGNVIIDGISGQQNRDPVADVAVKGIVGAGIGAAIDGKDGAVAGGLGSVAPNIIDRIFSGKRR